VVEADDFAAGTSSRSSKLIHGGLRYLAHGEVRFVRQIARERAVVHTMAPHLAEPCWMLVPTRTRAQAAGRRAGLGVYERLGAVAKSDRHVVWRGAEITSREPHLRCGPDGLVIAYREYITDDARLVIAVLRAAAATGAVAANRVPVVGLLRHGNRVDGVVIRCAMTEREVEVRSHVVVNAAGPWVEHLARMEQDPPATRDHLSQGRAHRGPTTPSDR
jgi:glycerol-3-phosphate dehydrogenase